MSSIRFNNVRIIDPDCGRDERSDLLIENGKICNPVTSSSADTIIDASNLIACPGLLDLYARLREPGQEKKGTLASETKAALYGGITKIVCSPRTDPVIDETATVELIHRRSEDAGFAKVYPLAALTQKLDGEQISELATLTRAGCIAASNANVPISNTRILRSIMEYAATFDIQLMFVAQDPHLAAGGVMHEGLASTRMGLIGVPVAAETVALGMLMELAWQTGARLHFSRVSSARGLELIRKAKKEGLAITADTSINHLFLTDQSILGFNSLCHISPPARSKHDRDMLREALSDGTLDAICTDHAPHEPDAKLAPFPSTSPGISGLDIFLPLLVKLSNETKLPLTDILALATNKPASLLNVATEGLNIGATADLVIFSNKECYQCEPETFHSKGKNSPYQGLKLNTLVRHCFVDGKYFAL